MEDTIDDLPGRESLTYIEACPIAHLHSLGCNTWENVQSVFLRALYNHASQYSELLSHKTVKQNPMFSSKFLWYDIH